MKHTPEPWELEQTNIGLVIVNTERESLATVGKFRASQGEVEANAERIVECVNACRGIPSPTEAIQAAREALEWYDSISGTTEVNYDNGSKAREALAQLKGEQE